MPFKMRSIVYIIKIFPWIFVCVNMAVFVIGIIASDGVISDVWFVLMYFVVISVFWFTCMVVEMYTTTRSNFI